MQQTMHPDASSNGWINPKLSQLDTTKVLSLPIHPIASEYLPRILNSQVYDAAIETQLSYAANLSSYLENQVYLKREDTQAVFSFKIRGAYNQIAKLPQHLKDNGVVTCSAGNHAQGVALSAEKLGIDAIIVMPLATPDIKVNAVRRFGGSTVAIKLIHPFDDVDVIAGQGTIAMEILKKLSGRALDAVFVCVGGGGVTIRHSSICQSSSP